VAVEMAPIAKVGGMGDVVTALARAVQDEGHSVEVVVPKYDVIDYSQVGGAGLWGGGGGGGPGGGGCGTEGGYDVCD
jgi:starch synthase